MNEHFWYILILSIVGVIGVIGAGWFTIWLGKEDQKAR